jgi:hypothetical protein
MRVHVRVVVHHVGVGQLQVEEGHGVGAIEQGPRVPGALMQLDEVPGRYPARRTPCKPADACPLLGVGTYMPAQHPLAVVGAI